MISLRYILETSLNEGIYDKGILKMVYMIGTPGAGKSEVVHRIFAVPDYGKSLAGIGFKIWNQDIVFSRLLHKTGKGLDLSRHYERDPEGTTILRAKAQAISDIQLNKWVEGRLGVVIDGTGRHYESTKKVFDTFSDLGYDIYAIYVKTNIQKAIERNNSRERKLPVSIVEQIYKEVQNSVWRIRRIVNPNNFITIDNSKDVSQNEEIDNERELRKQMIKILNSEVMNPIGQQWIKNEAF